MPTELIAQVVLEKTAYSFDKLYSYAVPPKLSNLCQPGCRVVVPFGRGNTLRQGLIMSVSSGNSENLKSIAQVYDAEPIVNDEMLKLCLWFHERLFCTYFDAVNAVLPTGISLKMVDFYSACKNVNLNNLSDAEKQVAEFLINTGIAVSINKLVNKFGADVLSVLNNLVKNNIKKL